jgi:hypothetical protein
MKLLTLFLAVLPAFTQNYAGYNNRPVARESFLRSQWPAGNVLRDSSLIAYWPLAEWADQAYDYSGHSLTGTLQGNAPIWFTGKTGPWAAYFNKNNHNYIAVNSIAIPAPFTVSTWAWPNQIAGGYNRLAETSYSSGFYLGTDSTMAKWELLVANSALSTCASGGTVTSQKWTLVTAVYDGTNGYLYVNGSLVAGPCAFAPPVTSALSLRIGCFNAGASCSSTNSAWDGAIADFRIYGRALPAAEILALYNAGNH